MLQETYLPVEKRHCFCHFLIIPRGNILNLIDGLYSTDNTNSHPGIIASDPAISEFHKISTPSSKYKGLHNVTGPGHLEESIIISTIVIVDFFLERSSQ